MWVEIPVEEAKKRCKKNSKVLVSIRDLELDDCNAEFILKNREEYNELFEGVKTVAAMCDDLVKRMDLYTRKQDIRNIRPYGIQRIVIMRE